MDYENYKLNISKELDDIIPDSTDEKDVENSDEEEVENTDNEGGTGNDNDSKSDELDIKENGNKPIIKSFPTFTKLPDIKNLVKNTQSHSNGTISWYSKSDILWIINWYIEKNLDDDTDILVTVEYEEDYNDPQKITLETQPRPADVN